MKMYTYCTPITGISSIEKVGATLRSQQMYGKPRMMMLYAQIYHALYR